MLQELFRHNSWANQRLLEHCAGLPAELLAASAPGTYGTVIATLRHLSAAEERYLTFLEGERPRAEVMEAAELDLSSLLGEAAGRAERWAKQLAAGLDPDRTLRRTRLDGTEAVVRARTLIVQAIHHGNDHRTHVCTILGTREMEVPDLDAWALYGSD